MKRGNARTEKCNWLQKSSLKECMDMEIKVVLIKNILSVLQNLFDEIYITDIFKRNRVKNQRELEDLLNILSFAIGSLTNPEKLKNTFKKVKNQVLQQKL